MSVDAFVIIPVQKNGLTMKNGGIDMHPPSEKMNSARWFVTRRGITARKKFCGFRARETTDCAR